MKEICFTTKSRIDTGLVPAHIDLIKAYMALKKNFDVKYEPEIINCLHIKIEEIAFIIWESGKIVVPGKNIISLNRKKTVFNRFFVEHLRFFLKQP